MAYFQKTNPHADNTPKTPITLSDTQFLRELQTGLNTQDDMGNADPRFWVIKESRSFAATEDDYDRRTLLHNGVPVTSLEELCDIINDMDNDYETEMEDGALILLEHCEDEDDPYYVGQWRRLDNFLEYLDPVDPEGPWADFSIRYEKDESRVVPDTLFLTHRECEDHLHKYGYNYSEDAHAFAMTAVRSPQFERLIKFLRTVDIDKLEALIAHGK